MGDGSISQDEIDSILDSLTSTGGGTGGGGELQQSQEFSGELAGIDSGSTENKEKDKVDTENIPLLLDVKMKISVVLGNANKPIRDVLELGKGSIVELDRLSAEDVDIYVNDQLVGKGQIVALDDEYGVKITKILTPIKRIRKF